MLVRPIIDGWEPPRIERIAAVEARRLAWLPVLGLSGDLQQDLGRGAMAVEIAGSLLGDEARDQFLTSVQEKFQKGQPVDFVADIVKESKLERVLIESLELGEAAERPGTFTYRVVLREYTEPPEPPAPGPDLGLDELADLGLDLLDLPAITADIPPMDELLAPVKTASEELGQKLGQAGGLFESLAGKL